MTLYLSSEYTLTSCVILSIFLTFQKHIVEALKTHKKWSQVRKSLVVFKKIFSKIGILDDKSDPHSGSESSASEELSQHSNSIATSSTSPIIAAFTNSNSGKKYPK